MPNRPQLLKVHFSRPEDLHHFFYQQMQRGSILLHTEHSLPDELPAEVLLSVAGCSGTLHLTGHVAPIRDQDAGYGLRVQLDDPEAAISSVASFIALVDSLLLVTAVPPDERRWSARISASVPVWLRFHGSDQFKDYYTQDLSRTGVFVFAHDVRPPGTLVEVLLVPPGNKGGFVVQAAVTRAIYPDDDPRHRPGMGLHFTDVPHQATLQIEHYLRAVVGFDVPLPELPAPSSADAPDVNGGLNGLAPEAEGANDGAPPNRRLARIQARLRVMLRPTSVGRFRELYTQNISRGGLFVETQRPVSPGTEVEIVLVVPGSGQRFTFQGEVVHAAGGEAADQPRGMGVRLTVPQEAQRAIEGILGQVLGLRDRSPRAAALGQGAGAPQVRLSRPAPKPEEPDEGEPGGRQG